MPEVPLPSSAQRRPGPRRGKSSVAWCKYDGPCAIGEQYQRVGSTEPPFDLQLVKARAAFAKFYDVDVATVTRSWINQTSLGVDGWAEAHVLDVQDVEKERNDTDGGVESGREPHTGETELFNDVGIPDDFDMTFATTPLVAESVLELAMPECLLHKVD